MIGSHLSIAGGMEKALLEAESLGLDCVQVFTKNQQQWKVKDLDPKAINAWRIELDRLGWHDRVASHASYLINLASPDDELWEKSINLMIVEIERCEALGIPFLVHHPGAYTSSDRPSGVKRIIAAYKKLLDATKGFKTVCCLENTVGSGSNLGATFEELATLREGIVDLAGEPARVGYCFDTCHAHAAGHDMSSRSSADAVLDHFDAICGLAHLRVLHMNDSKTPLGSRRDRHEHIGVGTISKPPERGSQALKNSGFASVMTRPELLETPKMMETPKGEDEQGRPFDALNSRRLRSLIGK